MRFTENARWVVLTVCLISVSAQAEVSEAVVLEYQGASGIWVPDWMHNDILADVEELQIVRLRFEDADKLLSLRLERIELLKIAIESSETAENRAVEALDLAIEERQIAEDKLDAWYRHPALWVSIGIVAAVLLEVGAVKLFQELD